MSKQPKHGSDRQFRNGNASANIGFPYGVVRLVKKPNKATGRDPMMGFPPPENFANDVEWEITCLSRAQQACSLLTGVMQVNRIEEARALECVQIADRQNALAQHNQPGSPQLLKGAVEMHDR